MSLESPTSDDTHGTDKHIASPITFGNPSPHFEVKQSKSKEFNRSGTSVKAKYY